MHIPSPECEEVKTLPPPEDEEEGDGEDAAAEEVGVCTGVEDGVLDVGAGCADELVGVFLGGAEDEGGGEGVDEVVTTGATDGEEGERGGGIEDDEDDEDVADAADVEGANTELEDEAAPTLSAADDDVGWMSTEVDTTVLDVTTTLDVGTALLLSRLEVGLPALHRLIWRFRGTTEGTATGAEGVSGEESLAATAWRRWCMLRAIC